MSDPYFLVFRGRAEKKGWTGPWPPPQRMWVATGRTTGIEAFVEPDSPRVSAADLAALDDIAVVERYERLSYSTLGEDTGVIRGAEYILEGDHTKLGEIIALENEAKRLLGYDPHHRSLS